MHRISSRKRTEAAIDILMETLCSDSSSSAIIVKGILSYVEPRDVKDLVRDLSLQLREEEPLLLDQISSSIGTLLCIE